MIKKIVPLKNWLNLVSIKPVTIITTLDSDGNVNGMPARLFMPLSYWPPMVMIGVAPFEDTYLNIRDTGEFVINIPSVELLKKIWIMAQRYPKRINELEIAELTAISSEKVNPPRIQECKIHLECKLEWIKEAGDHCAIVGDVLSVSSDRNVLTKNHQLRLEEARFVYDLGYSGSPIGPDFVMLGTKIIHVNNLGSEKYEIAPFKEWLLELEERELVTSEKRKIIEELAEKLNKEKHPEVYSIYKERLTKFLCEIVNSCYSTA